MLHQRPAVKRIQHLESTWRKCAGQARASNWRLQPWLSGTGHDAPMLPRVSRADPAALKRPTGPVRSVDELDRALERQLDWAQPGGAAIVADEDVLAQLKGNVA